MMGVDVYECFCQGLCDGYWACDLVVSGCFKGFGVERK